MRRSNRDLMVPLWAVSFVLALLLPSGALVAQAGVLALEHDPITLRDERVPSYEVFETFLLHAAVIYDTRGPEAYRAFLESYGLNPDLKTLQELPGAFDDLEQWRRKSRSEEGRAARLGEIFAAVIDEIPEHSAGGDGQGLQFEILNRLRPRVSLVFVDAHPDFATIDEAEEQFRLALDVGVGAPYSASPKSPVSGRDKKEDSGLRVKLSFLGYPDDRHGGLDAGGQASETTFEWRRYAGRQDGSIRVIAVIGGGSDPLALVDMRAPSDEALRAELKGAGIDGLLRFTEHFPIEEELLTKGPLGCAAATLAAILACAACAFPGVPEPTDPFVCPACAAAVLAAVDACSPSPSCDQITCNRICVQACHLYGLCEGSSPTDCHCFGIRTDTPGCNPGGGGCVTTVGEVSMLRLDGGEPVQLPTEAITLRRLEANAGMYVGAPARFLMAEWAVVDLAASAAATKAAPSVRTLRSSSTEFADLQKRLLGSGVPAAAGGSPTPAEGLAIMVAAPPHEANSRHITMPTLEIHSDGLPAGVGSGKVAIRADFSEGGDLRDLEILADTVGGVSPELSGHIQEALALRRHSDKEHRVVAFAVLSVGESLKIESSLPYTPKCCSCLRHDEDALKLILDPCT